MTHFHILYPFFREKFLDFIGLKAFFREKQRPPQSLKSCKTLNFKGLAKQKDYVTSRERVTLLLLLFVTLWRDKNPNKLTQWLVAFTM